MKNILGYRDYSSQKKIRETIKKSINYSGEDIDVSELFYFFETSKQKTWLVSTNKRVYIILDDVRKEYVKVNKSYRIDKIYSENKLNVRIDSDYKTFYGRIYFPNETRGWLYSKKLFPTDQELFDKIKSIIERVIN